MALTQKTIKTPTEFFGVGIHSGQECRVMVHPADLDAGIHFVLAGVRVPALVESVLRCERSTVIGTEGREVSTIEHLMAAVTALGLTNLDIHVEGPEIPILDGSAGPFYSGLSQAGIHDQGGPAPCYALPAPVWVGQGATCVVALPHHETLLDYALHYDHPLIGFQECQFAPARHDFATELSVAATFALWEEVKPLLDAGLAKGGSLDNALIAHPDHWSRPLRIECEPVRHKCMDLLGDLSLLGGPIKARVIAIKAGHRWHVELVRRLRKEAVKC